VLAAPLRARLAVHAAVAVCGLCSVARTSLAAARRAARFEVTRSQEREVLTVEALGCAGREAEAADRADAFLREYPSSPLAELVRRFAR
jgi:hypothetical protein